jgi:cell fate (sporulation/competence/biofilm development) regulator YlbF (YheA/YmcA/DUF963 family)
MPTIALSAIEEKLHALCAVIASDDEVLAAREQAEAFLADESAVALYREMGQAEQALHHKQHSGERVSDAEIADFTALRRKAEANELVRSFSEAQETLQGIANLVNGFVTKTLEKGRVPTEQEVFGNQGGCGSGCGCHH